MYNASVIEYKKVITLIILFLRFSGNYLVFLGIGILALLIVQTKRGKYRFKIDF